MCEANILNNQDPVTWAYLVLVCLKVRYTITSEGCVCACVHVHVSVSSAFTMILYNVHIHVSDQEASGGRTSSEVCSEGITLSIHHCKIYVYTCVREDSIPFLQTGLGAELDVVDKIRQEMVSHSQDPTHQHIPHLLTQLT